MVLKNTWKHSRLRFYLKNLVWNYFFWLNAKPMYENKTIKIPIDTLSLEQTLNHPVMKSSSQYETKTIKRFKGYMFKGRMYLDNPGLQGIDGETWKVWINKGLIK